MASPRINLSRNLPRRSRRRSRSRRAHGILSRRIPQHGTIPPQTRRAIAADVTIRRADDGIDPGARILKDGARRREHAGRGDVGAVAGADEHGSHGGIRFRARGGRVGEDVERAVGVEHAAAAAGAAEADVGCCRRRDDAGCRFGGQRAGEGAPGGVDWEVVGGRFGPCAGVSVFVVAVFVVGAGS